MNCELPNGIYEVLLRSPKGKEQRSLAFWPTEEVKQDFLRKAKAKGIEVEIINQNQNQNEHE